MDAKETKEQEPSSKVNLRYVVNQLSRAVRSPDDDLLWLQEESRIERLETWEHAWWSITTGDVNSGASSPRTQDVPLWATWDIADGGFATGNLPAALDPSKGTNESWMTPQGVRQLNQVLEEGTYRILYPEHAALLCVVWLLRNEYSKEAEEVLKKIVPFFSKLQFYPEASSVPLELTPRASIATAGDVKMALEQKYKTWQNAQVHRSLNLRANRAAILRWIPIKFRLLELFEQTVSCPHQPRFTEEDTIASLGEHQFVSHSECTQGDACGWPCQQFPEDWDAVASRLLHEYYEAVEEEDELINKRRRQRGTTAQLISCLKVCVRKGPEALSGRQVGMIRTILACCHAKYGPDRWALYSNTLVKSMPHPPEFFEPLLKELSDLDPETGISDQKMENLLALKKAGIQVPANIERLLRRARMGTMEELVSDGLIKSGEMLASLAPAVAATAMSAQMPESGIRRLFYALSIAFKKRSQLLCLESQVELPELPWANPVLHHAGWDETSSAWSALEQTVCLELTAFPHAIIPNKLLLSLRQLVNNAETKLVLVDEIAPDKFRGKFDQKYAEAAETAGLLLQNTPYASYYGLEDLYAGIDESFGPEELMEECSKRAFSNVSPQIHRSIADNGRLLEWGQVISTHNLASLTYVLNLKDKIEWTLLVVATWQWIVKHDHQRKASSEPQIGVSWELQKKRHHREKIIANGWRQLLFYLSMMEAESTVLLTSLQNDMEMLVFSEDRRKMLKERYLDPLEDAMRGTSPKTLELGWGDAGLTIT